MTIDPVTVPDRPLPTPVSPAARRLLTTPPPQRRTVTVTTSDGVQLSVRDQGPHNATHTVLMLHGFCLNRASWAGHADALNRLYGNTIRVIIPDHRGHGQSGSAPMRTYTITRLAQDQAEVLAALNVTGNLTVVGHSMGGMVALAFMGLAAGQRPVEPTGLVLAATAAGRLAERGLGRLLITPGTTALFGVVERAPERALKALAGPVCTLLGRWYRNDPDQRATLTAVTAAALASTPITTAVGFLPALRAFDEYQTLSSIQARTVVVSGGADYLTPPAHAQDLAAAIAGAQHVHIKAAGHMLPQQAPGEIGEAIRTVMTTDRAAPGRRLQRAAAVTDRPSR